MKTQCAALLVGLAAVAASAQTNDPAFASWRWHEDVGSPRAAGMAGAFVAVADDSSAQTVNPAGLVRIPKLEVSAALLARSAGGPALDRLRSNSAAGFVGGSGLVTRRIAIGGFLAVPHDRHLTLPGPDGAGFLDTTVTDAGAAVGWQPSARVSLGLRVNVTHLRLQAQSQSRLPAGDLVFVGMAAGRDRVTGDAGVLVDLTDAVRFGASFRQGASWTVDRLARNVTRETVVDSNAFELRSPSAFSVGLAYRRDEHVLVTGQADYVFHDQIGRSLSVRRGTFHREDYGASGAVDARGGVEVSWNAGSLSFQLRGGAASRASGTLSYTGPDAEERIVFQGARRKTQGAVGASIVTAPGAGAEVGFHAAATFGDERSVVTGGISVRF